jgi:hypothetical protein
MNTVESVEPVASVRLASDADAGAGAGAGADVETLPRFAVSDFSSDEDSDETDDETDEEEKEEEEEEEEQEQEASEFAAQPTVDDTAAPARNPPLARLVHERVGTLVVQRVARERVRESDPLVVVLDAAVAKEHVESVKEAVGRLLHCLASAAVARRVTLLCAGTSDVLVVHPSEPHVFPLVDVRTGTLYTRVDALASALNQRVASKNVAFVAKTFAEAAALATSNAFPPFPRLIPALRLAARVLSHVATRADHAQVLVVWGGGADIGTDLVARASARAAANAAASAAEALVPAFAALPCPVGVSCVALGERAPLDVLGAVTNAFDGLLTYATDAADAGAALAAAMRFLGRRPTPLLVRPSARSDALHVLETHEAREALARARTTQLMGEEEDEAEAENAETEADGAWTWRACTPAGAIVSAPSGKADAVEAAQFYADGVCAAWTRVANACVQAQTFERARERAQLCASAANALSRTFSASDLLVLSSSPPLSPTLASFLSALQAAANKNARAAFVVALAHAQHPFLSRLATLPDQADALEALECDTSVLEARAELAREQPQWLDAHPPRAARYVCALSGARGDVFGVAACAPSACAAGAAPAPHDVAPEPVLWAPCAARGFSVWSTRPLAETPEPIRVGPALDLALPLVALRSRSHSRSRSDQAKEEGEKEEEEEGEGEGEGEKEGEGEGDADAVDSFTFPMHSSFSAPGVLPLFLRTQDVANTYVSVEASRALAALVRTAAWRDPLLSARVFGGLVGRWLLFACRAACGERNKKQPQDELAPPTDVLLVADVCRSLALGAEAHLVADMFSRFVRGTPAKEELAQARTRAHAQAQEQAHEDAHIDAHAALALLERGTAWRDVCVCDALPALGAIVALWRNSSEHERARGAAINARIEAELATRRVAARAADAERLEEQVATEKRRRAARSLPPLNATKEKALRRKLAAAAKHGGAGESGGGGGGGGLGAPVQGGAALDEDAAREEIAARIVDVDVRPHVKREHFRITAADAAALCETLSGEMAARGEPPAVAAALAVRLRALYDVGDDLVFSVPPPERTLAALRGVFGLA